MSPHKTLNTKWWTLKRRRWAYGILVAVGQAIVIHGIATTEQAASYITLGGAILGIGTMALANPTKDEYADTDSMHTVEKAGKYAADDLPNDCAPSGCDPEDWSS